MSNNAPTQKLKIYISIYYSKIIFLFHNQNSTILSELSAIQIFTHYFSTNESHYMFHSHSSIHSYYLFILFCSCCIILKPVTKKRNAHGRLELKFYFIIFCVPQIFCVFFSSFFLTCLSHILQVWHNTIQDQKRSSIARKPNTCVYQNQHIQVGSRMVSVLFIFVLQGHRSIYGNNNKSVQVQAAFKEKWSKQCAQDCTRFQSYIWKAFKLHGFHMQYRKFRHTQGSKHAT